MAYGDDVMKAIRGTVLDGHPRIGGVGDAEASARARRAAALSAAADYARSGRGGQGDSDMHLERAAEEALSQAALAGLMTYGRSALALGRRTLADQLARRRASPAAVLRRTRYQGGAFGEGVETLSDTALNPSTLTGARPTGRLGEVATVSEEYSRAYPGIERDVVVNVVPDSAWDGYVEAAKRARAEWAKTSDTSRGFFDRRLSAVSLRAQMPGETMEAYFDRADRTLVHELQHYAQMRDGLPATSPGSGYEWYRTAAREVDARNSANRLVLTPQERAEIPRSMTQDVKPEDVHLDDKGGKSGGFRGWKAYRDAKEAAEAEAAAVAVVNAGITNAPPLSAADLADSRASAEWLKSHERRGLVAEGTLPHTGRPRFYSGNGFMEGDMSFQGDRFSSVVPVDPDAYHGDAEAYKKTGRWAVIPTVYPDADGVTRLHTSDAAESEYRKSGSHFGIFEGMENAESGAQWDHHMGNAAWAERETRQAAKGGDNFGTFRNFLATDEVPESIFGIPVVHDESQYTEKDLEFFRKNPKAAGFYDLGDEEVDEDVPQQAAKAKPSRGAYPGSLNNPGNVEKRKERRQGEVDSPHERWAKFATPQDGLREMADVIRQIAEVKLAEKGQDFTIRNFAEVYAPRVNEKGEKENDTDKYIADISADSGFDPDEELHRFDEGDMAKLLKSVVKFDSGAKHSAWFTDDEYAEAARKLQEGSFD